MQQLSLFGLSGQSGFEKREIAGVGETDTSAQVPGQEVDLRSERLRGARVVSMSRRFLLPEKCSAVWLLAAAASNALPGVAGALSRVCCSVHLFQEQL